MFKLVPWSSNLDLSDFYAKAAERGFENNSSQKVMVDCFKNEQEFRLWILYENDNAVASGAIHSLPELGDNAYRICARTCAFAEARPAEGLLTLNRMMMEHQHITTQFFIPQFINWAGLDKELYISSHPSNVGTQKLVHNRWCPALVKTGALERTCDLLYRGHVQTFWKLNVPVFLEQLNRYPRWN
jgi:hypothetical protein